jgi:hypothetical protein
MLTIKRRLVETLRRIHYGSLPILSRVPFLLGSGKGDGQLESTLCCDGCGDPIAQYETCYEVPRPTAAALNFHGECFAAASNTRTLARMVRRRITRRPLLRQ